MLRPKQDKEYTDFENPADCGQARDGTWPEDATLIHLRNRTKSQPEVGYTDSHESVLSCMTHKGTYYSWLGWADSEET